MCGVYNGLWSTSNCYFTLIFTEFLLQTHWIHFSPRRESSPFCEIGKWAEVRGCFTSTGDKCPFWNYRLPRERERESVNLAYLYKKLSLPGGLSGFLTIKGAATGVYNCVCVCVWALSDLFMSSNEQKCAGQRRDKVREGSLSSHNRFCELENLWLVCSPISSDILICSNLNFSAEISPFSSPLYPFLFSERRAA